MYSILKGIIHANCDVFFRFLRTIVVLLTIIYDFSNCSDVSSCSTPSALQLALVVLRIQPSGGTALQAVKGVSQLPSFTTAAGIQLDVDHLLDHVFASYFSFRYMLGTSG